MSYLFYTYIYFEKYVTHIQQNNIFQQGIPEKWDPGPEEDPGIYEDSEFFHDPGKTQELINQLKFLDFHTMCLSNLVEFTIKGGFAYNC